MWKAKVTQYHLRRMRLEGGHNNKMDNFKQTPYRDVLPIDKGIKGLSLFGFKLRPSTIFRIGFTVSSALELALIDHSGKSTSTGSCSLV